MWPHTCALSLLFGLTGLIWIDRTRGMKHKQKNQRKLEQKKTEEGEERGAYGCQSGPRVPIVTDARGSALEGHTSRA